MDLLIGVDHIDLYVPAFNPPPPPGLTCLGPADGSNEVRIERGKWPAKKNFGDRRLCEINQAPHMDFRRKTE